MDELRLRLAKLVYPIQLEALSQQQVLALYTMILNGLSPERIVLVAEEYIVVSFGSRRVRIEYDIYAVSLLKDSFISEHPELTSTKDVWSLDDYTFVLLYGDTTADDYIVSMYDETVVYQES